MIPFVPRLGGALLDVGGGVGATAVELRNRGAVSRVGVVDLVTPQEDAGADFAYSGSIEEDGFIEAVGAAEGPFKVILCLDVLEHLVDPWAAVARLHRVLAPGGVIVGSIPNVRHYSVLLPLLFRNDWSLADAGILDRTHLRFFVRRTAVDLMTSSGLELDLVQPIAPLARRVRLFDALTLGALRSFTALQYVVRVSRPEQDQGPASA